jgi:hypothetical protein
MFAFKFNLYCYTEGAGVNLKEEDLFVVGEDYDDEDSFGFVPGFVTKDADHDDDDDYDNGAARGGKSNRRKVRTTKSERDGVVTGGKRGGGGAVQVELYA